MKRILVLGLAIFLVLSLVVISGCGGGGSSTTTAPTTGGNTPAFTAGAVAKGEPYKLVFLTQPGGAKAFEKFTIQPMVGILDSDGNIVSNSSLPISINLTAASAGSSTLSGTLQVNAINGQSIFTTCAIEGSGTGFVLIAKSSGLQDGLSAPFDCPE
jgi:hypothetical protein